MKQRTSRIAIVGETKNESNSNKVFGAKPTSIADEFIAESHAIRLRACVIGIVSVVMLARLPHAIRFSSLFAGPTVDLANIICATAIASAGILSKLFPALRAANLD